MTSEELKQALIKGTPVKCNDITYKCVSALIYRVKDGNIFLTVELQDRQANSRTIAKPKDVEGVYNG